MKILSIMLYYCYILSLYTHSIIDATILKMGILIRVAYPHDDRYERKNKLKY